MIDHTQAALHHLGIADHSPSVDNAISEAQTGIGHALLAIADAIRGLALNATQDAPGCPQIDPQPEPGQLDGDGAAEATGGDFPCCGAPNIPYRATVYADVVARAEKAEVERDRLEARAVKAEAERDEANDRMWIAIVERHEVAEERDKCRAERNAILTDLRAAFRNWTHDAGHPIASDVASIINRHTPEG